MDRRKFLRIMGMAGAAAAIPWRFSLRNGLQSGRAYAFAQSPTTIQKFVVGLPGLGPSAANSIGQYIPVATPDPINKKFMGIPTDIYHLTAKQYTELMHPNLPAKTTLRGYSDNTTGINQYLGPVIVATRGKPVLLNMTNALPNTNIIPVDPTIMATASRTVGQLGLFNRIVVHLHGGFVPWFSDGGPFAWFTPSGVAGASFRNVPGTAPPPGTATYYYPNNSGSRLEWYHDHAMGLTRTNAYMGIASGYVIIEPGELNLINKGYLPGVGIPLVIQEKTFVPTDIATQDPTWKWGGPGKLWYPHTYEGPPIPDFSLPPPWVGTGRFDVAAGSPKPLPAISVVPEFFGDTAMVNGTPYPVVSVTDKRFRFRILNASQARFWHLNLYVESATTPGEADLTKPGPALIQIGSEGGWLPAPVIHTNTTPIPLVTPYPIPEANPAGPFNLLLAPAERADIIIDFKGWAGAELILYSDAPSPFPGGDARNEYFTGNLDLTANGGAPSTLAGFGPNTRTIMKIEVGAGIPDTRSTASVLTRLTTYLRDSFLSGRQPGLLYSGADKATPGPVPYAGPVHRRITFNEDFDDRGRLIQRAGTTDNAGLTTVDGITVNGLNLQGLPTWGRSYLDPTTENPVKNATEVWELYNLTGDVHPWHFHLVNIQVIQRAQFDAVTPVFAPIPGTERLPDPNEYGWKETVRVNPGEVATVIMKFSLPTLPAAMGDPKSPRTGGHEYVHHCHILEHEEHDMMRPLVVV